MAFNPILETNIQPTQQVQRPSAAGAALDLVGSLFPAKREQAPPSRTDLEANAHQNTLRELSIAAQTGDTARANSVYRNHASQFGVGTSPEIDSAFTAITSQNPTIATYGGDNSVASIESNPNYPLYLEMARGSNPSASPDELRTEALGLTSQKMANDAKVANIKNDETITWSQAQPEYDKGFNIALTELRGMIEAYNADSIITPDEAGLVRSFFSNAAGKFTAPPGVNPETYETYRKAKWGSLTDLVEMQLNNALSDGPSKDMQKATKAIIDKLTTQGRLSPVTEYAINSGGANADAVQTILNIYKGQEENPEWTETMRAISTLSFDELVEYSKSFEEIGPEHFEGKVDTRAFRETVKNGNSAEITNSLVTSDKAMIASVDPLMSSLGVQSTIEKVNALEGLTLDGPLLKATFDSSFFSAIERISDKNPTLGAAYITRLNEVLANQQTAIGSYINRVANANGFSVRSVNGKADFYPDPALMSPEAKAELDKYFNGDWNKAWAANGRMVMAGGKSAVNATPNLSNAFTQITKLNETLSTYDSVLKTADRLNGRLPKEEPVAGAKPVAALGTDFKIPEQVSKDTEFLSAVSSSSTRLQIEPDWLLRVIDFETASTWSPKIKNPGSSATGLIQFLDATAKGLGTTTEELASMTRGQQMAYVEKYLEPYKGRLNNFGDVYMAVHWPAGIGKDEGYIMYREGSAEYKVNKGLDSNRDGTVTRGETLARVLGATGRGEVIPFAAHDAGTAATGPLAPAPLGGPSSYSAGPSSPAPDVSGVGYQPTTMVSPEVTPQVVNSNPDAKQAIPQNLDPAIAEFIEGLKKGRQEFASMEEVDAAKASGKVSPGDIVFVGGRPVIVK